MSRLLELAQDFRRSLQIVGEQKIMLKTPMRVCQSCHIWFLLSVNLSFLKLLKKGIVEDINVVLRNCCRRFSKNSQSLNAVIPILWWNREIALVTLFKMAFITIYS